MLTDLIKQRNRLQLKYRRNFNRILKLKRFGTREHKRLLDIEHEIYKREDRLLRQILLLRFGPMFVHSLYKTCPIHMGKHCFRCTGYYRQLNQKYYVCQRFDIGAMKCGGNRAKR
jgi:hypothetical protein